MPDTGLIGAHQLSAYANPQAGQSGTASVVLGNDNNTVTGYNGHDNDATIHVQDSTLATRPAAGVEHRKWFTNDGYRLYYDTGAAWVEAAYLPVAGGTVTGNVTMSGTVTITSASASALAVGLAGATNPAFVVDASTASQAAGLKVTGSTATGTVAIAVISSSASANVSIDAKGSGTITIGAVSTGNIILGDSVNITSAGAVSGVTTLVTTGAVSPAEIQMHSGALFRLYNAADDEKGRIVATSDQINFQHVGTLVFSYDSTLAVTFAGLIAANAGLTVASGQTLTLTGATVTGLTAASVAAGTFPSGAYVFQGAVSGITTLAIGGALSGVTTLATSSTINSQTISATANFTGTVTVATGLTVTTGGAVLTGAVTAVTTLATSGSVQVNSGAAGVFRVGAMVTTNSAANNVLISDGTAPTGNPAAGGFLFSESGALKWRGSSGTITTVAPA